MYSGNWTQRIDSKGRVAMPASFRAGPGDSTRFYAFPSFLREGAIECRSREQMDALRDRIDKFDPFATDESAEAAEAIGMASVVSPDAGGRFVLPDDLREHVGAPSELTFVGCDAIFFMYAPARYRQVRAEALRRGIRKRQERRERGQAARQADDASPPDGA